MVQVTCPSCGKKRGYSTEKAARRARRLGRRCHKCANSLKNQKPKVLGFSEAEYNTIRDAAVRRKKIWALSIADIHDLWERQDGLCAMTGMTMRKTPRTWSIDRIDNACGYTPGNVQLVLKEVNMMRGPLDVQAFVSWCQTIVQHRSENETD